MEECRRTRSQGPPSLPEGNELGQWGSLPDPSQIEREHSEALRLARQVNTATNMNKNTVESSEILQVTSEQSQYTEHTPHMGEISPKHHKNENLTQVTSKMGKIPPNQHHKEGDFKAMEEGTVITTHNEGIRRNQDQKQDTPMKEYNTESDNNPQQESPHHSPQGESGQQYLDDNFLDVMRSSAIGSNVSSLFNTTAFTTTHNKQKITLDWILPDGKNS